MNSTLSTAPGRYDRPPPPYEVQLPVRRVGLLDRIALHVGLALIKWGRRPVPQESRERRALRYEQHVARLERERLTERAIRLGSIPR